MKKTLFVIICALLLNGCSSTQSENLSVEGPFSLKLTGAGKKGDEIVVSIEKGAPILDVQSKSGIGRVEISAKDGKWRPFKMRLHLKSLESFEVDNKKITATACFVIRPTYKQLGEVYKHGNLKSAVVNEDSKYWIPIKVINRKDPGSAEIPLEDGYFEVTFPDVLFEGNPEKLYIEWIDYLRR
ncbi:hypothetical protein BVX94_01695 [bacterium B17]|nr:hypothetical protein BVX94_01695 [bacterium B17]